MTIASIANMLAGLALLLTGNLIGFLFVAIALAFGFVAVRDDIEQMKYERERHEAAARRADAVVAALKRRR